MFGKEHVGKEPGFVQPYMIHGLIVYLNTHVITDLNTYINVINSLVWCLTLCHAPRVKRAVWEQCQVHEK